MAERAPNIVFVLVIQRGARRLIQARQDPMLMFFHSFVQMQYTQLALFVNLLYLGHLRQLRSGSM